jgi:hypothetical protein
MYTRIMKSQFLPNKPTRRQQHIFRFLYLARNVPHESDNKTRRSSRVFSLSKAICRICIHFHTLAGRHIQQNKKQRAAAHLLLVSSWRSLNYTVAMQLCYRFFNDGVERAVRFFPLCTFSKKDVILSHSLTLYSS